MSRAYRTAILLVALPIALLTAVASCAKAADTIGQVDAGVTIATVTEHYDQVSGKRFLVFKSYNCMAVVEAPPLMVSFTAPQVEATGPHVERSRTYGPVPPGWQQYGTDPATGMKLVERVKP